LDKIKDRSDLKDVKKALADSENEKHRKSMGLKLNYTFYPVRNNVLAALQQGYILNNSGGV